MFNKDYNRFLARKTGVLKIKLAEILKIIPSSALSKLTITNIVLDRSLENAIVYYQPFPGEEQMCEKQIAQQLSNIYSHLLKSSDGKRCPRLKFVYDRGLAHAAKIDSILNKLNS